MLRRFLRIIIARKRGDSRYWRQLYLRESRARDTERALWAQERTDLLNRLLVKHNNAPILQESRPPAPPERVLSEEEAEDLAIANEAQRLAQEAAYDDFAFEVAQLNATRDPVWKPIVAEAERIRRGDSKPN